MKVVEYIDTTGRSLSGAGLIGSARRPRPRWPSLWLVWKAGHFGDVKPVGGGVIEHRIHAGPGYRVYFGRDGTAIVVLLAGGSKRRQSQDVEAAKTRWADYRTRQKEAR